MAETKKSLFDNMTDDQIVSKARALAEQYANVPPRQRPQAFYDFGNKAAEIERTRRKARVQRRSSRETEFNTGLSTTWKVPTGSEQTRNRLAALIFQESGPRKSASPEYTMLGERIVASVLKNYMDRHGLTIAELLSGKGQYGGPDYLPSIVDVQQNPGSQPYSWTDDKFNLAQFTRDDTTFKHMTNAVRLASALVNGTLRPLTSATHFKHLGPTEEFKDMARINYDFGNTPVPADRILKLYDDIGTKQAANGGNARADAKGGKVQRGKLKRWEDYKDAKEAMAAEAEAVAFVNAGIIEPQPLSEGDLADSRRSAKWLADNPERKGLLKEGTLPHIGRPRFVSLHGFREADYREGEPYGFQGDRYSTAVAVDQEAFQKNPKAYEQSGQWAVIPTVFPDADGVTRLHTVRDSEAQYRKTGEHFGIFDSVENANRGSEWDHHRGNAEWAETHEDAKGGDTGPAKDESILEPGGASVSPPAGGGPRIVINPSTFRNEKDALCVAFNEAFRLIMEEMGFNPVSEPTDAQRKFFSDTAYRNDELQLRRTILARICTFDTSVKDPTDEQIQEAQEFLENVLEAGFPQNEWEQSAVQRIHDVIARVPTRRDRQTGTQTDPSQVPGTSPAGS